MIYSSAYGPRQVGKSTLTGQILDKQDIPNAFVSADAVAAIGAHLVNHQLSEGYTVHYWRQRMTK